MSTWKPKFIQLPIDKMAGAPWNLLDARGFRIAWCGTDGNHEKDGELIANDLLNLIAIGEAVGELHEKALESRAALESQNAALKKRVEELENCVTCFQNAIDELSAGMKLALGSEEGEDVLRPVLNLALKLRKPAEQEEIMRQGELEIYRGIMRGELP